MGGCPSQILRVCAFVPCLLQWRGYEVRGKAIQYHLSNVKNVARSDLQAIESYNETTNS